MSKNIISKIRIQNIDYNIVDNRLDNFKLSEDYTAFEVFAHESIIPVGEFSMTIEEQTFTNAVEIPGMMTHDMKLRTMCSDYTKSDVIIDWGDGTIEAVKDGNFTNAGGEPENGELNLLVSHTYDSDGKYIVKIYGKDYYCIYQGNKDSNKNLLCRAIDQDLPISNHFTNLSYFLYGSLHLLYLNVDRLKYNYYINLSSFCSSCTNLVKAVGFKRNFTTATMEGAFANCKNLIECDAQLPLKSLYNKAASYLYNKCSKLNVDINSLIPEVDSLIGPMDLNYVFNGCSSITGTLTDSSKKVLWDNDYRIYNTVVKAFVGCSDELRAQVPTILGGTNELIDHQLEFKNLDINKNDYTAFEVFAHDYDIPVGENSELGGYVNFEIPACMTHIFNLRSEQSSEKQDVVIDWGDGYITKLCDITPTGSEGNYYYYLSHTYKTTGKYIVKIYGYSYFAVAQGQTSDHNAAESVNNLLCRCLEVDLPVASHLTNFSSFAYNSQRLLKLNIYGNKFGIQAKNISSCFCYCRNLLSVVGFSTDSSISIAQRLFEYDVSLINTDFRIPASSPRTNPGYEFFNNCENLEVDINKLLPNGQFKYDVIDMRMWFRNCKKLYGTVPADKLWGDTNITWTSFYQTDNVTIYYPFEGCSEEIRAQVPVSWGGTNKLIDAQITIDKKVSDKNDYTSFEVFAHDYEIPVGEFSMTFEEQTVTNAKAIPAGMEHAIKVRTMNVDTSSSDVIIDWGDGTTSSVVNEDFVKSDGDSTNGERDYYFSHSYTENGKYIVKVYGKDYYSINNGFYDANCAYGYPTNLICRVFDYDLPIASHLVNLSSFLRGAINLLYINVERVKYRYISNMSNMCLYCVNLIKATGFKRMFTTANAEATFRYCENMTYCDAQLPDKNVYGSALSMFTGCTKLAMDINKFIPATGIHNDLNVGKAFQGCVSLTGTFTDYSKKQLWNNQFVNWAGKDLCFSGCSDEIRAQVPASWGGTASDDIIEKSDSEKIAELTSRLEILEQYIQNNPSITDDTLEFE